MTDQPATVDFAIIGAGIAGASVAAELARDASVVVLEMEQQPGYHSTGRSAAMFEPGYGPPPIQALSRASEAFFCAPPEGFVPDPLLTPRGVMALVRADQTAAMDRVLAESPEFERCDQQELYQRYPFLRPGYAMAGVFDPTARDIDVHALHQGYLRRFTAAGGTIHTRAELRGLRRDAGLWHLDTAQGPLRAGVVINAAGAWADQVGQMAGAERIGLVPKRRTAMIVEGPEGVEINTLPMIADIEELFYLKPDAGRLFLSPANADPMPPCDVQPEDLDIALCIDRVQQALDLDIRRIHSKWAGLRSFVPDKAPVVGYSQQVDGFFWLAAQGGYGIQTAPALSRSAAALVTGAAVPADVLAHGLRPETIAPERLRDAA